MLGERRREIEVKITARSPDEQQGSHVKNEITNLLCVLKQQLLSPDTDLGGGLFQEAKSPFDELPLSDRQLILEVVRVRRLKGNKYLWTSECSFVLHFDRVREVTEDRMAVLSSSAWLNTFLNLDTGRMVWLDHLPF